jgi:hypothetical protein
MNRLYNVLFKTTDASMVSYNKTRKANSTPMTHKEACTFKSKMPNHDHGYFYLEERKLDHSVVTPGYGGKTW